MNGIHVIRDAKSTAFLPRSSLIGWRWTWKDMPRTPLEVSMGGRPAAVLICKNPKIKMETAVKDNRARFRIKVNVTAMLAEMLQPVSEEVLRNKAARQIEKEIRSTFKQGVDSQADIFQLGAVLHRRSPDVWKAINRDGKLPLSPDTLQSIDVTVNVISSGRKIMEDRAK